MEILDFFKINLPNPNLVLGLWFFIMLAVFIDLMTGVYKAKALNYLITSEGLKRSVNKLVLYFSLMAYACMMDIAATGMQWINTPYISIFLCLFILLIEGKSVLERANEKERKRLMNGAKDVTAILASKDELAKTISEYLSKKEKEEDNGES